ncbi:TonB-dependent receptor P3 [subsurface metagenome]
MGYIDEEIQVNSNTQLSIELDVEFIDLKEIVVIGYGTQKKSDITGAITSVSEDQLKAQPVSSIDQALQGKAAGVIVQQTSGSPAGNVSVLVRGASSINASSQPLYVIDGIPISNMNTGGIANIEGGQGGQNSNPLATINPDDIESIEILKDASATAIYGSRGANGVILISTKRGKEGKNNLSFSAYYGFQQLPKKLDVLNSYDYARYRLMQHMNSINSDTYPVFENPLDVTDDQIPFTTLHPDSFPINTDWQKEMYQTAPIQNYHLSASGGSEKIRYSLSGGYYGVDGILVGSSYERLSLKANTDATLSKWFQMGNTLMFSYSKEDMTFNDAYYGGGIVERALQQRPDMAVRDSAGNYAGPSEDLENAPDNPIAAELEKQNDNVVSRIVGNIYGQLTFFEGFTFRTIFGTDLSNSRTTIFEPSVDRGAIYVEHARMQEAIQQNLYWSWENYFTFNRKIALAHDLTVMAGYSRSYTKWDQFSAFRDNFPNNESRNLALGSEDNKSNGAYAGDVAMESFFGRLVYDYNNLVTFTHTSRVDGSSKFGSGKKRGYFPSFAMAWKFSNHGFMQSLSFINFAKLRISYGKSGNDNIDPTDFLARLRPVLVSLNNQIYPAYEPDGKDNPDLNWETVISYNLGLDVNMLENRLQLITDFYIQRSEDMLIQLPLPITSSPFGEPWSNSATMENKGVEVNLISHILSGNFNWSVTATYSFNRNKVLDLSETVIPQRIRTQDPMITQTAEGYPIAQFYGFVTDGIFRSQEEIDNHAFQNPLTSVGDIRFKDLNGDGTIDENDKAYIGNPVPMHVFGLTNNLVYKGFDLSIFLQGMLGNKVFNMVKRRMEAMNTTNNQFSTVLDAYTPEDIYLDTPHGRFLVAAQNTTTDIPRMTLQDYNNNLRISDRFVEDASFLKIQTITLGYTLPKKISNRIRAERLRIYVTGKNLYTFTKYTGYEPEHGPLTNNEINNALLTGVDIGNYPIPRSVVFGINLDF